MKWLDRLFMRQRAHPRADRLPEDSRRRLRYACRELTESERQTARTLALEDPPRMVLVDEETAVILPASIRWRIEDES